MDSFKSDVLLAKKPKLSPSAVEHQHGALCALGAILRENSRGGEGEGRLEAEPVRVSSAVVRAVFELLASLVASPNALLATAACKV